MKSGYPDCPSLQQIVTTATTAAAALPSNAGVVVINEPPAHTIFIALRSSFVRTPTWQSDAVVPLAVGPAPRDCLACARAAAMTKKRLEAQQFRAVC